MTTSTSPRRGQSTLEWVHIILASLGEASAVYAATSFLLGLVAGAKLPQVVSIACYFAMYGAAVARAAYHADLLAWSAARASGARPSDAPAFAALVQALAHCVSIGAGGLGHAAGLAAADEVVQFVVGIARRLEIPEHPASSLAAALADRAPDALDALTGAFETVAVVLYRIMAARRGAHEARLSRRRWQTTLVFTFGCFLSPFPDVVQYTGSVLMAVTTVVLRRAADARRAEGATVLSGLVDTFEAEWADERRRFLPPRRPRRAE